jgi:hypothetical protein
MTPQDRVAELRAWAQNRIDWCRYEERKFGASSAAIEAATERRSLQAVLRILDGEGDEGDASFAAPRRGGAT